MKIMCQEHYDEVVRYAKELGDESLQACLAKLRSWEEHFHRPCEIELYRQRYPDGSLGIVGGLVYHGMPDRSGCYTMNREDRWQTHT